ncbi:hypothetical protein ACP4OV_029416 [Aristida adscensionis]
MASASSSAAAAAAAAIPAAPPSTLSPHAAPFTLPPRPACAPPPRRRHDGDASGFIDDNFLLSEDKNSYPVSPAAYFGVESSFSIYPASTSGLYQSQPSSSSGAPVNVYPSSASSASGIVSEPSVTTATASFLKQQQSLLTSVKGRNGSKCTTVTIKSPPNRTSQTTVTIRSPPNRTSQTKGIGFGSMSKLAIREDDGCNKEIGKDTSFHTNVEPSDPANGSGTSLVADDVNPDPSECSVDSPCWRGISACRVSSDVAQTSAAQTIKQEIAEFEAGQEQNSSTVQYCEASTELQNSAASKSKQNHSQLLGLPKKPGNTDTNLAKDPHGEELENAKHGAERCIGEQKHSLEPRDNCMKRSGLNSAAPDFIPSSVRNSNSGDGSCSSTGRNVSGILKAIESLSEVLWNNCSDEIELDEHDHSLLQSVVENLQNYLRKARKGPVKCNSDKAGQKVLHSQNAVSKSVVGNCNGNYTADNGKGIIISNLADSTHLLDYFGRNSLKGCQPSLSSFPRELSGEDDHSQLLVYKSLWIDAERINCELKHQLKQTRMETDLESSMAHIGGGSGNPSFQLCDMGTGPSNSYRSAIAFPPMLKGNPGARKSHVDCVQSGDGCVVSRSKDYIVPKNIHGEHLLSSLEDADINHHVRRGLQLVPNRTHRMLNSGNSDGMSSLLHITGRDGILSGSCEFGSSDWEHVLKEEIR